MRQLLFILSLAALAGCDVDEECFGECGWDSAGAGGQNGGWEQTPSGETYEHYGTNDFIDPRTDDQVTFAVDVDTGSYTLARNSIESGVRPAAASVRVEEFINFFDYRDRPPESLDVPFAVHTEVAPSPFGDGMHLLRIGLKGYEVPAVERPSANLVFLIDVSGSMDQPNKLGLVQYALRRLVQTLRPDDTIALVVYAGAAGTVLDPTPVEEADVILAAIGRLRAGGSTNGSAGIDAAYAAAEAAMKPGGVNRIILCSDGDFNVGTTGEALYDLIETKREAGVSLSVFGFGRGNYNDRDMEQMADRGNGNYAFIDKEAEAERVLVRGITGTLLTIAKDVKIQVDLNPDLIARYRLIGYENRDIRDDQFRDDSVDAGEIGAGHTVTAFIEMEFVEGYAESASPFATVNVRWKAPDSDVADELAHPVMANAIGDALVEASRGFRFGAAVAEFAEILRESPHSTHALADVLALAQATALAGDPDQAELVRLIERVMGM